MSFFEFELFEENTKTSMLVGSLVGLVLFATIVLVISK